MRFFLHNRSSPMKHTLTIWCLIVLAALLCPAFPARGQCPNWLTGPVAEAMKGANGAVRSCTLWDPDGFNGPISYWLVVGGDFTEIGGVQASHIAAFDGENWRPLGSGMNNSVRCLKVYNGDLVAGGRFTTAGGGTADKIAIWTGGIGGAWHAMGNGLNWGGYTYSVECLEVYQSYLYAGGDLWFVPTTGGLGLGLAKWSGTGWTELNLAQWRPNAGSLYFDCYVSSLAVFNNELVVGGGYSFDSDQGANYILSAYNGTTFRRMDQGFSYDPFDYAWAVTALQVYGVELVVGGVFSQVQGQAANNIVATTSGTFWHPLGGGLPGSFINGFTVYQSQLIALCTPPDSGGVQSPNPSWNGVTWAPFGGGLSGNITDPDEKPWCEAACVYNNALITCGNFSSASGTPVRGVAWYTTQGWWAMPTRGSVYAATTFQGRLVEAGDFHGTDKDLRELNHISTWNGAEIDDFDGGVNAPVFALKPYTSGFIGTQTQNLVVGGDFNQAGTILANHIAVYSQSLIAGNNNGWGAMGSGVNGRVNAIERFNNINYAGGEFTARGDNSVGLGRIARYTAGQWNLLAGSDLNGPVYALKVFNNALYAGGSFTNANGLASGGLARWDGTSWSIVGGFFNGTVYSLEVYENQLVIGGLFAGLSGSPNLARYNGVSYSTLGTGGTNGAVRSLCVGPDGQLYIGGDFTTAGGASAFHEARYNGTLWSAVYGGTDGTVRALTPFRNEVVAGGTFSNVRSIFASRADARYTTDGIPWVAVQPFAGAPVCAGQGKTLAAAAAAGYTNVTFAWRRAGTPLNDGPTPSGTVVSGAHTATLTLSNLQSGDGVMYDCVVSTPCGSSSTFSTRVYVNSADFNGDGDVGTDADIEAFFACLAGNCCTTCGSADFNGDGDVGTDADIEAFFRVLAGGAC